MPQSLRNEEKAQFSYAIYFIVVMIMFTPILLIGFPVLQTIAIGFMESTEGLKEVNAEIITHIDDPTLRADVNSMNNAQIDSQETRISILNDAIIFGVIFIVIIVFIGIYLLAKRNVEVGQLG
jgi:hypothetical protein